MQKAQQAYRLLPQYEARYNKEILPFIEEMKLDIAMAKLSRHDRARRRRYDYLLLPPGQYTRTEDYVSGTRRNVTSRRLDMPSHRQKMMPMIS